MALDLVTVVLNLYDGALNPVTRGTAALVPSSLLTGVADEVEISQQPIPAAFRAGSFPTVRLLATSNTGPAPSGWTWGISFAGMATPPAPFSFSLTASPLGFTATSATPAVFTAAASGFANGTAVALSGTSLPGGFTAGTVYYVTAASGDSFSLAATPAGPALASTSTGSGNVDLAQLLSGLTPEQTGATFQAYMLLPGGGPPAAGQVPAAVGDGSNNTQWADGGGTGGGFSNPMSAVGDLIIGGVSGGATRLAGNTATTRKFLRSAGTGSAATAEAWDTLVSGDIPSLAGLYDAAGAAATAQSAAQSFATAAVATETTRATTAEALLAPKASPALTGTPTAPTATALTSTTQLATTAYADLAVGVETTRATTAEALLAPKASPALTGTPTAPTKTALTNSTAIATTAYADAAVAVEASRAQAAEALALPLAGGTMSGAIAMGSHKVTGLTNGSSAQDAAAFGQIPTALPPNGAAGGVLSGSYPNPGYATTPLPQSGGTMTGWLAPAVATLTFVGSGTTLVNAALGNAFALTLTASTTTLGNPSSPVDGQAIRVRLIQDATGSRTIAFGTAYDFGAAGAPTLSTAANKVDILGFEYVASLSKWCYLGSGLGF